MESFLLGLIEQFPVLLILLYLVIRQDQRIDELVKRIDDCSDVQSSKEGKNTDTPPKN